MKYKFYSVSWSKVVDGDIFHMNGQKIRVWGYARFILLDKASDEFQLHPLRLDP